MNKDKLIKILVPIVAVIVIIESIVLIPTLGGQTTTDSNTVETSEGVVNTEQERSPVADFVFSTSSKEMKVGKSYKVVLNLVGKESFAVDAIETYVSYDPKKVSVSGLAQGKDLPVKTVLKVDNEAGLVSSVFLVDVNNKDGYQIKSDEVKEVISFMVTPKIEGEFSLNLVHGDGEVGKLVTVLPETGTSDELPFNINTLDVNATK